MRIVTFAFSAAALVIQQYADYYRQQDLDKTLGALKDDYGLPRIQTWDYIVVGGGSAGCLLAERLSEHYNVLLLEKGGDPVPTTYNGRQTVDVYNHPAINDLYPTYPQQYAYRDNGGVGIIQNGRMLSGSGSHNVNIYNRGSPHDYNNWANLTGDESWRYENLVKYFKEFENFQGVLVNESQRYKYYASTGPLHVQTDLPRYLALWFNAGLQLGYPISDPNGYQIPAFTPVERSVRNGLRESTYAAFIRRLAVNRRSLTIYRYSSAEEILINDDNEAYAYGVAYTRHGIPQIAHAKREVIVTSGPFGTPSLLIKSGIGPKDVLNQAGIHIRSIVPGVGQNLHDHLLVVLTYSVTNLEAANTWMTIINDSDVETELEKFQRPIKSGVYTQHIGPNTQAMFASSRAVSAGEGDWADVQIGIAEGITVRPDQPTLFVYIYQGRVRSKGQLLFNTTAYLNGETEDLNLLIPDIQYFSNPSDMQVYIEGIKFAIRIMEETTPFHELGVVYNQTTPQNCQNQNLEYRSDAYWACFIMNSARTAGHRTGTCKMGASNDPMAVVDSNFRVRGVKNLRVCDSSIFPQIPNSNINSPTMLTATKAVHSILGL